MSLVSLIIVLAALPTSSGRRVWPLRRAKTTSKPSWITPRPPVSSPSINEKECSRVVDKLPKPPKYHVKFLRGRRLCVRLNETQLMNKLRKVSGFNPRYMAVNGTDACRFQDLATVDELPLPREASSSPQAQQDQPRGNQLDSTEGNFSGLSHIQDETDEDEMEGNVNELRQKRMISLSPGSTLRGCWSRGSTVDSTNLRRLCTECAATTKLPATVFPPFINEVICEDNDRFCFLRFGRCVQRVIKFTFLRRTGEFERDDALSQLFGMDIYVEEWEEYEQNIRSCCECRIFSFFGR